MNIIRFIPPQSRDCSVKLAAHGQLARKKKKKGGSEY